MIFILFTILLSLRSGKVKALMREAAQLKNNLPIHPNASILVRQVRVFQYYRFKSFPRFRSCSNSASKLPIDYDLVQALICCLSEYKPNLSCSLELFERANNTVIRIVCYPVHNELGFSKLKLIRWIQLSTLGTTVRDQVHCTA